MSIFVSGWHGNLVFEQDADGNWERDRQREDSIVQTSGTCHTTTTKCRSEMDPRYFIKG